MRDYSPLVRILETLDGTPSMWLQAGMPGTDGLQNRDLKFPGKKEKQRWSPREDIHSSGRGRFIRRRKRKTQKHLSPASRKISDLNQSQSRRMEGDLTRKEGLEEGQ